MSTVGRVHSAFARCPAAAQLLLLVCLVAGHTARAPTLGVGGATEEMLCKLQHKRVTQNTPRLRESAVSVLSSVHYAASACHMTVIELFIKPVWTHI